MSRLASRGSSIAVALALLLFELPTHLTAAESDEPAASAQEENGAPAEAKEEAAAIFTGAVVVTAQRREESLVEVPISITSTSAEELDELGVVGLMDLESVVPGMRVDHYGAYSQPTIRGVGTQDVIGPGASANVAIYVDEFYLPSQAGNIFEFANIERVDVLKGPQGTLFGQNATGGAILVTTPEPSFASTGWLSAGFGNFGDYRLSLYGTTGLSDKVAADWSFYTRESDGYLDDINTGKPTAPTHNRMARTKLLFKPNDAAKFILTLEYSDVNDPTGLSEVTRDPIAQFYNDAYGVPILTTLDRDKTSLNYQPMANPVTKTAQLKGVFQLGDVTFKSLTQYRDQDADIRADLDGTTILYWNAEYEELEETLTQEFNFTGSTGRLDWTAGVYYFDDTGSLTNNAWNDFFNTGVRSQWLLSESEVATESIGAYVDGAFQLSDNLWLTLGGRFTSEEKTLKSQGLLDPFTYFEDSTTWEEFTPRAVIRRVLADGSSVYGSFSQGFMSGNYTYTSVGPQKAVDPEKITQYEIGYKTARKDWSFDTAAFMSNYKDLQVFLFDPSCVCFVLDNAPKAETYGWEGHLAKSLTRELSINLGAAYTHARYKEYVGVGLTGGPYLPPNYGLATGPTDFSGRQMVRTPEWTGSLAFSYNPEIRSGRLNVSGSYYYTSDIPLSPGGELVQSSYGLAGLRVGWTPPSGAYTVSAFGKNIFDETYLIFSGGGFLGNNHIYGAPISYGLQVDFRY